ncbi:MAG: hypothetical protein LBS30_07645 [Planctomycetota bacterium]|jgi:flagellar biosynthesis/type III secretory pathway M-ring protein FliF/YscJ|nr:hypothetical protein [Planctomycetota bacterium]
MGQILTLIFLLAAGLFVLFRLRGANRRAGDALEKEKKLRLEREQELLSRLERVREKKDDLEAARDAIAQDPRRAAKVVSKMMRSKE